MMHGASLTRMPACANVAPKTVISANVIVANVFFIFFFPKSFLFNFRYLRGSVCPPYYKGRAKEFLPIYEIHNPFNHRYLDVRYKGLCDELDLRRKLYTFVTTGPSPALSSLNSIT